MKSKFTIIPCLILLCGIFATTTVLGQTTYVWTGAGNGTNLSTAANWNPNGLPSGNNGSGVQDTAQWDGSAAGSLDIGYQNPSLPFTGFGSIGIDLHVTGSQINSVQIRSSQNPQSPGVGINNVTVDSGAGAFTWGDDTTDNNLLTFGRPAGAIHMWINNSSNPARIGRSVRWQAGGGAGYTYEFSGTGDWIVNNSLMPDNGAFSPSIVQVDGPGTVFWTYGKTNQYNPNSRLGSVVVLGGKLVIKSSGLFTTQGAANQGIQNESTLAFDAPSDAETLSGVIMGAGAVQVVNGTLTLSGQSTYSGTTLLSGGTLAVGGAETEGVSGPLGFGGTISFAGGTLAFSVNNVWDYSGRFSSAASQAYSIDTAGQNVAFTNSAGLSSSGGTLTKVGSGTLTLAGPSTYTGATTVSGGRLVFQGTKSGTGNITVADSAILGVYANQITPNTLTVGNGCALGFNELNSTTTAPIAAGTIASAGTIALNINSGAFVPGNSYPLISWSSGSAPDVSLAVLNGFIGNLSTNGNTIQVNITATAYKWTGNTDGNWDLSTGNNWEQNGGPVVFANGGPVLIDDSSTRTNITVGALVQPTTISVVSDANAYTITSSGGNNIGGSASLTKGGNGALILAGGANTYTGVTKASGGTLSVASLANGGAASDIGGASSAAENLVLDGGTLQYTGSGASIDRRFTLSTSGGTLDSSGAGALNLNATGSLGYEGNAPRTLTLTGTDANDNTIAGNIANNGGATSVNKSGDGKWVLSGANTYSGATTIAGGTLQIGAGGTSGSLGTGGTVNNASLVFDRDGSLTVSSAISGPGTVTKNGPGTVVYTGNNSYLGLTTINAGRLQINGAMAGASDFVNDGDLFFNNSSPLTLDSSSSIAGNGNLIKSGGQRLMLRGQESYNGYTLINSNALLQIFSGNEGAFSGTGWITNHGILVVVRQDNNVAGITNNITGTGRLEKDSNNPNNGDVTLMGTNDYIGGTRINGGGLILGDGTTPGAGSIIGNVVMTNYSVLAGNPSFSFLTFQRAFDDDITFPGNITGVGQVQQNGFNVVTLTGNNNYSQGILINTGTLQDGNGGTGGGFSGNLTDNGAFIWNRSVDVTYAGVVDGGGTFEKKGTGTLTMTSQDWTTFFGPITITAGKLAIAGFTAPGTTNTLFSQVDLSGGTLSPGVGSVTTIDVQNLLNLNSGTVVAYLNTSTSPSNTFYAAVSGIGSTSGTLKVINAGPPLQVGQKFTIFSQAVNGITVVSPGFTVQNNLATDGSVTVTAVQAAPTLSTVVAGDQLNLSWEASWAGGVHLQGQTNSLAIGISSNWVTIPGTDASSMYSVPIRTNSGAVFYRLTAP